MSVVVEIFLGVTDLERRILDFAYANKKIHLTYTEFGWRPVTFTQRLLELVNRPEIEAEDPIVVRRIRDRIEEASRFRAGRTFVA